MKLQLLSVAFLCLSSFLFSQSSIENKLEAARKYRPMEKLYLQTDRSFYQPGEVLWFKAYLTDDHLKMCGQTSYNIYVQLFNPKGQAVQQAVLNCVNGQLHDGFKIPSVGGVYVLKAYTDYGNKLGEDYFFEKKIMVQNTVYARLGLTLEVEKTQYLPGDRVLAKLEANRIDKKPIANTECQVTAAFGGQVIYRHNYFTDGEGRVSFAFDLPNELPGGNGLLQVTITDGGVTESVGRQIPVEKKEIFLTFFPEGGDLSSGWENKVAFEALDKNGRPVDCNGYLFNEKNDTINEVHSFHKGMGAFFITPRKGEKYYVQLNGQQKKYELPAGKDNIIGMRVINGHEAADGKTKEILIEVNSNFTQFGRWVMRKGGEIIWESRYNVDKGKSFIKIPIENISAGVVQLTLFDWVERPICERLIFLNRNKKLIAEIKTEKENYFPGEKVNASISVKDKNGEAVSGNFSMAIVEERALMQANDRQDNILSRLLLTSELEGTIEEPAFYFDENEEKSPKALDLLMLTHGWRRYDWQEIFSKYKKEFAESSLFKKDQKYISGTVWFRYNNLRKNIKISISGTDHVTYTDKNGRFKIYVEDIDFPVELKAELKGYSQSLRVTRPNYPQLLKISRIKNSKAIGMEERLLIEEKRELVAMEEKKTNASISLDMSAASTQSLDEVVVVGLGVNKSNKSLGASVIYVDYDPLRQSDPYVFMGDDIYLGSIIEENNLGLIIRQDYSPHYYRNRSNFYPTVSNRGIRGRNNFSKTVYWFPELKLENGEASVSFTSTEEISTFMMVLAGVGDNGELVMHEEKYFSQLPFSIDANIPPALTFGDTMQLEVLLRNNTEKKSEGVLRLIARDQNLEIADSAILKKPLLIPESGYKKLNIPLVVHPGHDWNNLELIFEMDGRTDVISKKIKINPRGFLKEVYKSGKIVDNSFSFNIEKVIPGTMSASFRAFPHVLGEITDGLSSIIREPHGCFEQVSSSNYPNILALQVLQENGLVDFDLKKRAENYLKKGCRKLSGYETSYGGFSLYGKGKPSKRLTAYGILQFWDMKKVLPQVNEKIIDRSIKWLFENKNKRDDYYYGTYLTDLFILFAFSELKNDGHPYLNNEKRIEDIIDGLTKYDKKLWETNDPYILAMAICANKNMGRPIYQEQLNKLLELLNEQRAGEYEVKQTFALSYGKSLQVETAAWSALALLKTEFYGRDIFYQLLDFISKSKNNYGGFGSTQATVMCLKVLKDYHVKTLEEIEPGEIMIAVNGETKSFKYDNSNYRKISLDLSPCFVDGENSISILQSNTNKPIPVTIEANWRSFKVNNNQDVPLEIVTKYSSNYLLKGDFVKYDIIVKNVTNKKIESPMAIIGIPSGLGLQDWQLREIEKEGLFEYFEVSDSYLIAYFGAFQAGEQRAISLDLKANVAGHFQAPASLTYPYYTKELKHWAEGKEIVIYNE